MKLSLFLVADWSSVAKCSTGKQNYIELHITANCMYTNLTTLHLTDTT